MADTFNFYLGSGIMFGNYEAASLAFGQKVDSREKVTRDGLRVTSAQSAPGNKVVVRRKHWMPNGFLQFIEQEPGPRGSPQLPQGPGDGEKLFCELPTAKLESC